MFADLLPANSLNQKNPPMGIPYDSIRTDYALTAQLHDAGFSVTGFENEIVSVDPDLIAKASVFVVDITMPTVGREEAISRVKERFPELPIIAITSGVYANTPDVFGKLPKPFFEHELIELVREALHSQNPKKPQIRKSPRPQRQNAS